MRDDASTLDDPDAMDLGLVLVPRLLSIARVSRHLLQMRLAEIDVAVGQDHLLVAIEPGERVALTKLGDRIQVRASTTSKMVDRLAAKGWVVRKEDRQDSRRAMVSLTDAGVAVRRDVERIWRTIEAELAQKGVEAEDGRRTLEALGRMADVLARRLDHRRCAALSPTVAPSAQEPDTLGRDGQAAAHRRLATISSEFSLVES